MSDEEFVDKLRGGLVIAGLIIGVIMGFWYWGVGGAIVVGIIGFIIGAMALEITGCLLALTLIVGGLWLITTVFEALWGLGAIAS